jgi:hypothetical protein
MHERDYAHDAQQLGFQTVGVYRGGQFLIDREWRPIPAVYVWITEDDNHPTPIRVGETLGLGGRFTSYNAWLRGKQWTGARRNAREQEKARLARLRLGPSARVIATRVPDKRVGLAIEAGLLQLWQSVLDLNFELAEGWARARMREWAVAYNQEHAGTG